MLERLRHWIAGGRLLPDVPLPHRPGSRRRPKLITGHHRLRTCRWLISWPGRINENDSRCDVWELGLFGRSFYLGVMDFGLSAFHLPLDETDQS